MRRTLKHDLHEHTLILRKLSEDTNVAYHCKLCQAYCRHEPEPVPSEIENQVYCCEDCGFFIHKWCAEFPHQIQHPSHPQHPLSLYISEYFDYECGESGCDKYAVDATSAIATLPNSEDTAGLELEFFGHHHPLNLFRVDIITETKCQLCSLEIRGCSVYGCRVCLFLIHESCAQLPRKIEHHPLHPEHQLSLTLDVDLSQWDYDSQDCKLCDQSLMGLSSYICYECAPKFGLHAHCAIASTAPPSDLVKQDHIFRAGEKLISCYLKGGRYDADFTCQICFCLVKPGKSYVCTRDDNEQNPRFSSFFVHKTCAELPRKLQHPLCPNSITLTLSDEEYASIYIRCGVCNDNIPGMYYYKNDDGDFYLHTRCAVETLSAILKGLVTATIQHFAYTDLFFTCYVPGVVWNREKDECIACRKPVDEEIGYFCQKSNEKIHTSCAEKLKPVIDHPFHPQHPLLVQYSSERDIVFCKGCNSDASKSYYYSCGECEFYLDLKCALRKPTLKDPCHQHDLAYFERVKYISCRVCGYCCGYDLYRCVGCNFSVHRDCLHLPSLQDNGSKGMKPEYSHSLKKKIDIVKCEIESAKSSVEEYQRKMQRKMASLDVLESLKSGWGETGETFEEDFLQTK